MNANTKYSVKFLILTLTKQLKQIFFSYFRCLLNDDPDEYKIDIESGHLFHTKSNNSNCECGLFKLKNFNLDKDLIEILDDFSMLESERILAFSQTSQRLTKIEENICLIDCFESKINCLKIAHDILSSIIHLGVFIYTS